MFISSFLGSLVIVLFCFENVPGFVTGNCENPACASASRFRACPYNPAGLEVTRGIAGHCPVGEPVLGDCVTDEDCFLKRKGNICCYNRCKGVTECHRFP